MRKQAQEMMMMKSPNTLTFKIIPIKQVIQVKFLQISLLLKKYKNNLSRNWWMSRRNLIILKIDFTQQNLQCLLNSQLSHQKYIIQKTLNQTKPGLTKQMHPTDQLSYVRVQANTNRSIKNATTYTPKKVLFNNSFNNTQHYRSPINGGQIIPNSNYFPANKSIYPNNINNNSFNNQNCYFNMLPIYSNNKHLVKINISREKIQNNNHRRATISPRDLEKLQNKIKDSKQQIISQVSNQDNFYQPIKNKHLKSASNLQEKSNWKCISKKLPTLHQDGEGQFNSDEKIKKDEQTQYNIYQQNSLFHNNVSELNPSSFDNRMPSESQTFFGEKNIGNYKSLKAFASKSFLYVEKGADKFYQQSKVTKQSNIQPDNDIQKLQIQNLRLKEKISQIRMEYQNIIQNLNKENQENLKQLIKMKLSYQQIKVQKNSTLEIQTTNKMLVSLINKLQEQLNQINKNYNIKEIQCNNYRQISQKNQLECKKLKKIEEQSSNQIKKMKQQIELINKKLYQKQTLIDQTKINSKKLNFPNLKQELGHIIQQSPTESLITSGLRFSHSLEGSDIVIYHNQFNTKKIQNDQTIKTNLSQNYSVEQCYYEILEMFDIKPSSVFHHRELIKEILVFRQCLSALLSRCKYTDQELKNLIKQNVYLKDQNQQIKREIQFMRQDSDKVLIMTEQTKRNRKKSQMQSL